MEIRTLQKADLEQAWQLDRDAFHAPEDDRKVFVRMHDPARLMGAFEGERLVALTGARAFGQFFGGRSVPMGGLSSVSVVPDRRGRGLARALIQSVLAAMRERGEVISSLFPATTRLYRRLGWEMGGSYLWRSITPRLLQNLPRPAAPIVRPAVPDDLAALRDEILPANSGDWVLSVRKGRGRLEPGGSGAVQLGVGSLSSLYTGWATTTVLARAGLISGGSSEERAGLDAAFAGPTPWLLDEF